MSTYIGIMSGTSLDAVDAVLVSFEPFELLSFNSLSFEPALRAKLAQLCAPSSNEVELMAECEPEYTRMVSNAVQPLITHARSLNLSVEAAGFHGQTVRHLPKLGYTLQLGDAQLLTELIQVPVVHDFRRRDLAAGGQGAPLVPAFHADLFGSNSLRVVANLGGVANISVLTNPVHGYDTGPANLLMDAWCSKHTGKPYDENGRFASQGAVIEELLSKLLREDYFLLSAPKSTGRELFNLQWLSRFLTGNEKPEDVQRTLLELTAVSLTDQVLAQGSSGELYVCGGGALNVLLVERLKELACGWSVATTHELGLDPLWVEACAFAWLAMRRVVKQPGNCPEVTGAKGLRVLGSLTCV